MQLAPSALDRAVYWRAMTAVQLHHGSFTFRIVVDIAGPEHHRRFKNYLDTLVTEKVVTFESEPAVGSLVVNRYRIINLGDAPPIRQRDKGARQRALWTAIRSLKSFREPELAVAASTEDLPIGRDAAAAYIADLVRAGFLTIIATAERSAARVYRLQPSRNTGPRAPIVDLAEGIAFDLNLMKAVNLNASSRTGRAA